MFKFLNIKCWIGTIENYNFLNMLMTMMMKIGGSLCNMGDHINI